MWPARWLRRFWRSDDDRRTAHFVERPQAAFYNPAPYVLLNPFRELVTVKEPSGCADSLIQCAAPLWSGARGALGPGAGAGIGAMGIAGCGSSIVLAMNIPGTVYSCPLSSEK